VMVLGPVISHEQHRGSGIDPPTLDSSVEETAGDLMVKCSPREETGHVIPAAVSPPHDQQAHGLPRDLHGSDEKSADPPVATSTEPAKQARQKPLDECVLRAREGTYGGPCSVCSPPPSKGGWRQASSAVRVGSEHVMSMRCGDSRKMTSTRRCGRPASHLTWRRARRRPEDRGAETSSQSPAPTGKVSALAGSAMVTSSAWFALLSAPKVSGGAAGPSASGPTGNGPSVQSSHRGGLRYAM
jgi:hypothetical protein